MLFMVLYEIRKRIFRCPTRRFRISFRVFFLLKIFLISYSSRPYTQNRSASKAESYMKLRLEGLSDNLIRALALTGSIKASNFIN